jgi:hypothetical protein
MTVEQAMKPDAEILLPEMRNKEDGPDHPTNIANHLKFNRGNPADGFKLADYIRRTRV